MTLQDKMKIKSHDIFTNKQHMRIFGAKRLYMSYYYACYIRRPFQNAFKFTLPISSKLAILKFRSRDTKT